MLVNCLRESLLLNYRSGKHRNSIRKGKISLAGGERKVLKKEITVLGVGG